MNIIIYIYINYMEKILITGTGRCGTTFLIKLFTFLEFDTGYSKYNYTSFILIVIQVWKEIIMKIIIY